MSASLKMSKYRSLGPQGDPGLFGFLGKAVGALGGLVPGPIGGILGRLGGAKSAASAVLQPISKMFPIPAGGLPLLPGRGMGITRSLGLTQGGGKFGGVTSGGSSTAGGAVGMRTRRKPRMNYGNGRAINRAARRLEGAEKMFRRVFAIRHGHAAGKVFPKAKKR